MKKVLNPKINKQKLSNIIFEYFVLKCWGIADQIGF